MIDYNRKLSNERETQVPSHRMSTLVLLETLIFITRKDMALSAISMNSALADKEFVLSLHHKLHVSTCINKPNDVHKHNQSIINSINQPFLHKQQ